MTKPWAVFCYFWSTETFHFHCFCCNLKSWSRHIKTHIKPPVKLESRHHLRRITSSLCLFVGFDFYHFMFFQQTKTTTALFLWRPVDGSFTLLGSTGGDSASCQSPSADSSKRDHPASPSSSVKEAVSLRPSVRSRNFYSHVCEEMLGKQRWAINRSAASASS